MTSSIAYLSLVVRIGDSAKFRVDDVVEGGRLFAGEGVQGVGAGEGLLAEDSLVSANEGEVVDGEGLSNFIDDWETDVEDPTVVVDVGVVSVGSVVAGEGLGRLPYDLFVPSGELVGHTCGGDTQEGAQEDCSS